MCKAALPRHVSSTEATIILLFNIFLPGVGTMIASVMGRACRCDTFLVGVLQLFTAPLLIGWIWAVWWGVAACGRVGKSARDERDERYERDERRHSKERRHSRERPAPHAEYASGRQYQPQQQQPIQQPQEGPQQGFPQAYPQQYPDPAYPPPAYTQPYPADYPPTKPPL